MLYTSDASHFLSTLKVFYIYFFSISFIGFPNKTTQKKNKPCGVQDQQTHPAIYRSQPFGTWASQTNRATIGATTNFVKAYCAHTVPEQRLFRLRLQVNRVANKINPALIHWINIWYDRCQVFFQYCINKNMCNYIGLSVNNMNKRESELN